LRLRVLGAFALKFHASLAVFVLSYDKSTFFCPHFSASPFGLFPPAKSVAIGVYPWLKAFGCGFPLCVNSWLLEIQIMARSTLSINSSGRATLLADWREAPLTRPAPR